MRERSDFIQKLEGTERFGMREQQPGIECENEVIAFGTLKRVRSFICANRVLTYESSRESRGSKWRDAE